VLGLNYQDCPSCHQAIEGMWQADWNVFLAREQIDAGSDDETLLAQVVIAELDQHPWTIAEWRCVGFVAKNASTNWAAAQ
jgi:hypothetical protein